MGVGPSGLPRPDTVAPARPAPRARSTAACSIESDRSTPTTTQPLSTSGTALRPAPQPTSTAHALGVRASSTAANRINSRLGAELAKPATVSALFHGDAERLRITRIVSGTFGTTPVEHQQAKAPHGRAVVGPATPRHPLPTSRAPALLACLHPTSLRKVAHGWVLLRCTFGSGASIGRVDQRTPNDTVRDVMELPKRIRNP
jgi:hypothetical protein